MKKEILEYKDGEKITIEKEEFVIINRVKYRETSSYWYEFAITRISDSKLFYLEIDLDKSAYLYEIVENKKNTEIDLKSNIVYNNENYSIFESGKEEVEDYIGTTEVCIGDIGKYYEYVNNDETKLLSIEKWKNYTEISIGKKIKYSNFLQNAYSRCILYTMNQKKNYKIILFRINPLKKKTNFENLLKTSRKITNI